MKLLKSISVLLLAFLVMFSSTSFMVGLHYCMGEVQEVSLFSKPEGCKMQQALPVCHQHHKPACCEDEVLYHEGDSFKATIEQHVITSPVPVELSLPVVLISELIPSFDIHQYPLQPDDPLLPEEDLIVLHHVLLI